MHYISILILLNIYITSTVTLFIIYIDLIVGCKQQSRGLVCYSHFGNIIFPAWEHGIPIVGIFGKLQEE